MSSITWTFQAVLCVKVRTIQIMSMADLQLQLAPTTIFMDFETARTVFPGITVNGCFFHYNKAIWRKTQHTGLQVTYRNNEDIRQLEWRAAVLPMDLIEDVWFKALSDLEDIDTPANTTTFTDYVTTQWIVRWPTSMEQLQHRWAPYHKSHRGLAQQTEEESLQCTPKHLHIDQRIQRHPGSKWSNQNTA